MTRTTPCGTTVKDVDYTLHELRCIGCLRIELKAANLQNDRLKKILNGVRGLLFCPPTDLECQIMRLIEDEQPTEKPKCEHDHETPYVSAVLFADGVRSIECGNKCGKFTPVVDAEKRKGGCPNCGNGVTGVDPLCDKHYSEYLGQNRARGNNEND
jgi:hypothetical protein